MKKNSITLVILLYLSSVAIGQTSLLTDTPLIQYHKTIEVPSLQKKEVFLRSKQWILANLKIVKGSFDSDESGKSYIHLSLKIEIPSQFDLSTSFVNYDVKIKIKEKECQYYFDNFRFHYYENGLFQVDSKLSDIKVNAWGKSMSEDKKEVIRKYINRRVEMILKQLTSILSDC